LAVESTGSAHAGTILQVSAPTLVAIGVAVVMLLGGQTAGVFVGTVNSDPARLGAQVISGIGFLGAGTIMNGGRSVRGLTTADEGAI